MKLTPHYETKSWTVQHSDGHTESFQTRAAAVAMYPVLGAPVVKQDRSRDKRERKEVGEIRNKWGQWS